MDLTGIFSDPLPVVVELLTKYTDYLDDGRTCRTWKSNGTSKRTGLLPPQLPALPPKTFNVYREPTLHPSCQLAHSRRFRDGKTLAGELSAAMHRIGALGVQYPDGYCDELIAKYEKDGVPYPHILSILGEPRIRGHFFYARMPGRTGPFLDYGCGTGDNIRQLLRDGFPRAQITGFDLTRESINLGFDLYRDEDRIRDLFVVNDTFPFGEEPLTPSIPALLST